MASLASHKCTTALVQTATFKPLLMFTCTLVGYGVGGVPSWKSDLRGSSDLDLGHGMHHKPINTDVGQR